MKKLLLPTILMTILAVSHFAADDRWETLLSGTARATYYLILVAAIGSWIAYGIHQLKRNAKKN